MNGDSSSTARVAPVTQRGQKARLRLLHAAEKVFGEKGYEGASVAEICQQAESALGSFYVYFPDKKAAFVELVDGLGSRLRGELAAAVQGIEHRLDVERAGLRAFLTFASKHRRLYRIVGQAEFVDEPCFRRYHERLADGYAAGLKGAMRRGEIRTLDSAVLAYSLMGMADFVGMRWVLWEEKPPIDHVVDVMMDLLRSGVAMTEPKPTRKTKSKSRR